MESIATVEEIKEFLTVPGSGSGSGYGDGYGYGDLKKYEGHDVYYIDDMPCIIRSIHRNIAKVDLIGDDYVLTPSYVAKVGRSFAHGESIKAAVRDAEAKELEGRPLEERLDAFVEAHPDLDTPYPDLFQWHHTLTGSCEFGRKEWCKAHGYQPTDSITVRTFIEQTKNNYGSDAIRQLADRYGLKLQW